MRSGRGLGRLLAQRDREDAAARALLQASHAEALALERETSGASLQRAEAAAAEAST